MDRSFLNKIKSTFALIIFRAFSQAQSPSFRYWKIPRAPWSSSSSFSPSSVWGTYLTFSTNFIKTVILYKFEEFKRFCGIRKNCIEEKGMGYREGRNEVEIRGMYWVMKRMIYSRFWERNRRDRDWLYFFNGEYFCDENEIFWVL